MLCFRTFFLLRASIEAGICDLFRCEVASAELGTQRGGTEGVQLKETTGGEFKVHRASIGLL